MTFISSKKGIAIVALIAVFAFLYFFTGVFGDTRIGLTLRTNQDLQNGLVAHYTFDAGDVNGFTVSDSSGNSNDGVIVATTTAASSVAVDTTGSPTDSRGGTSGSRTVWINDSEGFIFYADGTHDLYMASTSDSGATWGNIQQVDSVTNNVAGTAVWYDQWTPGDTGNYIHVVSLDEDQDQMFYTRYDTLSDTLSTSATVTAQVSADYANRDQYPAITKLENGRIYVTATEGGNNVTAYCKLSDCTSESAWTAMTDPYVAGNTYPVLMPVKDTDHLLLIYWQTGNNVYYNFWSATSSSWWGSSVIQSEPDVNPYDASAMSATTDPTTGDVFLAFLSDIDSNYTVSDHDITLYQFDISDYTWTQLGDIMTDTTGLHNVKLSADTNRDGHLYVAYTRRTTITDSSTGNVYWRESTDRGQTWSAEYGPLNAESDDIQDISLPYHTDSRLGVTWKYTGAATAADDVYYADIRELGDYADEKTVPGNIGQGMTFDGVDDYVQIGDIGVDSGSFAAWVKPNFAYDLGCSPDKVIFGKSSGDGHTLTLEYNGCASNRYWEATYRGGTGNTITATSTSYTSNSNFQSWTHLAITWNNSTGLKIYQNGLKLGDTNDTTNAWAVSKNFRVGAEGSASAAASNPFEGYIDDVRAYNRELSDAEILRLYQLGATTKINKTLTTNPDLEDGLVGHWTFDGVDTDLASNTAEVIDRGPNSLNGDWRVHATTTQPGVLGQSLYFDGTDDFVDLGSPTDFDGFSELSISAWIKPTEQSSGWRQIFERRASGCAAPSYDLAINWGAPSGRVSFIANHATTDLIHQTNAGQFSEDEWVHIGVSWDGGLLASGAPIYINGEEVSGYGIDTDGEGAWADVSTEDVGISTAGCGSSYMGAMDDVRLYDRVLSPAEFKRLYQLGATTKINTTITTNPDLENGLVGHWTFDGAQIDIGSSTAEVKDRSGNGNDGNWLDHASSTIPGVIGQAIEFDGSDDLILVGQDLFNSENVGTIAAWVKIDDLSDQNPVFALESTAHSFRGLATYIETSGKLRILSRPVSTDCIFEGNKVLEIGTWYHVVFTSDGSNHSFYIDGVDEGTLTDVGGGCGSGHWFNDQTDTPNNYNIGEYNQSSSPANGNFSGMLDDVRVYDRQLSAAEILRLYQLGN